MHRFRLRAECRVDVERLRDTLERMGAAITAWTITLDGPYGLELAFSTNVPESSVRTALDCVPDNHVMAETLATPERYTGERTYRGRPPGWLN